MDVAYHARTQVAATILSIAVLAGFAVNAPRGMIAGEGQSFIGTMPEAAVVETQPATF